MFTNSKIRLSDLLEESDLTITRDAEISFAGKLSTDLPDRIVPLSTADQLKDGFAAGGMVAVITTDKLAEAIPEPLGLIQTPNPMAGLSVVQQMLVDHPSLQWKRFTSRIHPTAQISPAAVVAPYDVVIGPSTVVSAGANIGPRSIIGARCLIGPQTHIGAEGFQRNSSKPGHLMPQSGGVQIGDDVTMQSGCVISRAVFGGFTRIENKVLIDSLVSISHDCKIGSGTVICAKVSISGGSKVGNSAYLGPNSTISNGITIGDRVQVSLGAVVTQDVSSDQKVSGNFALPHENWLKLIRQFR